MSLEKRRKSSWSRRRAARTGRARSRDVRGAHGAVRSHPAGTLSKDPPGAAVELLEEMAADVRPENMTVQLSVLAEADQRDLPAGIAVPTLLVWGAQDARSLLSVARQFELAIPDRADGVFRVMRTSAAGERVALGSWPDPGAAKRRPA
jgi:pimeloyl-ACP methyl ester carboxylesterase